MKVTRIRTGEYAIEALGINWELENYGKEDWRLFEMIDDGCKYPRREWAQTYCTKRGAIEAFKQELAA